MPLYLYSCQKCKDKFERFLSVANYKQPELEPCPSCNEMGVLKEIQSPNMIQFDRNIKTDDTFRDILKQIGKNNKHSTIDENFGGS